MNKYHYVYRITNTKLNKHYYGTRSSNIEPFKDLGVKYFSSASDEEFRNDQKNNPQDYKYVIVSVFNSRKEAMQLEIKLHTKFNVGMNESFYNKCKASSTKFDTTGTHHTAEAKHKIAIAHDGILKSEEHKKNLSKAWEDRIVSKETGHKISESLKGRENTWGEKISKTLKNHSRTEEHCLNISKNKKGMISTFKGKMHNEESKTKMSKVHKGKTISKEQKEMISKHFKGKKQTMIECPYCNKIGGAPGMKRYHFNNCKQNPSI